MKLNVCGRYFVDHAELLEHKKTKHREMDTFLNDLLQNLETLNKTTKEKPDNDVDQYESLVFKKVEVIQKLQCVECNGQFETKTNLRNHLIMNHETSKVNLTRPLECGLCVIDFGTIEKMDEHMDESHSGRWKLDDPDVVFEGDDYVESSDYEEYTSAESNGSKSEVSETQSGEE